MNLSNESFSRADVSWKDLLKDLGLIAFASLVLLISIIADISNKRNDWFSRAGGITVVIGAILAYLSLKRHYVKFFLNTKREPLITSKKQEIIDKVSFILTILGTLVWAYGDKFLTFLNLTANN